MKDAVEQLEKNNFGSSSSPHNDNDNDDNDNDDNNDSDMVMEEEDRRVLESFVQDVKDVVMVKNKYQVF